MTKICGATAALYINIRKLITATVNTTMPAGACCRNQRDRGQLRGPSKNDDRRTPIANKGSSPALVAAAPAISPNGTLPMMRGLVLMPERNALGRCAKLGGGWMADLMGGRMGRQQAASEIPTPASSLHFASATPPPFPPPARCCPTAL